MQLGIDDPRGVEKSRRRRPEPVRSRILPSRSSRATSSSPSPLKSATSGVARRRLGIVPAAANVRVAQPLQNGDFRR